MMKPVDATQVPAWGKLTELAATLEPNLREWFAQETDRVDKFTLEAAGLHVDLSKNLITDEVAAALVELAEQVGLEERREAMFNGEHINVTEDRAVLHTALRSPEGDEPLIVDGQDVHRDVHAELRKIFAFADKVREGQWVGVSGKPVKTIVNIGIGGSDLGPVMAYEALKPFVKHGLECRFISNIDPTDIGESLKDLDPSETLFIIVSKTFTTLETLTNARVAKRWLIEGLEAAGLIEGEAGGAEAVAKHFVAVSTALDLVEAFGIDPQNAFGFWNWVGGRFSVDSAVGTVLACALGPQNFADFLGGFNLMDQHFRNAKLRHNVPVMMGLLNVWYRNFLGCTSHAVLPYSQYLHRFPAYLQQLTMESNGKSVRWDGSPVTSDTGEVFWGEPGTNGQHAFYQLLHQGTSVIPADFIAFSNPVFAVKDEGKDQHELFLSNFFAQSAALAFGKTAEEVRAEGTPGAIVPARVFSGNRPSTSIMAVELSPAILGALISLYEHITFVQGIVWGIDSFDQWGVELGKKLAMQIYPAITGDEEAFANLDASTQELIQFYRETRANL